jgi:predicted nucleic acid-binding protein
MNGMTENRFVLDTNAVIFFITDGNIIPAKLEAAINTAELYISIITEIELFSKPDLRPEEESGLKLFIADNIPVVDISPAIKKEAIALRRSTKIKLPDCIIAATSIVLNAVLLTDDDKLLRLAYPGYRARILHGAAGGGLQEEFRREQAPW